MLNSSLAKLAKVPKAGDNLALQEVSNSQATPLDRNICQEVGRHGVGSFEVLQARYFAHVQESAARTHLAHMIKAGWLTSQRSSAYRPGQLIYILTDKGKQLFDRSDQPRLMVGLPSYTELKQQLMLQAYNYQLEQELGKQGAKLLNWQNERELRSKQDKGALGNEIGDARAFIEHPNGTRVTLEVEADGFYYGKALHDKVQALIATKRPLRWITWSERRFKRIQALTANTNIEVVLLDQTALPTTKGVAAMQLKQVMKTAGHPELTAGRKAILQLLAQHKALATSSIHLQIQSDKDRTHTLRDLRKLKQLRMVSDFAIQPELGQRSEKGWKLRQAGATAIGMLDFGSKDRREPSRKQADFRALELEVSRQVEAAGYTLVWPIKSSPANLKKVLPAQTPQHKLLAEAVSQAEYRYLRRMQLYDPTHPQLREKMAHYTARLSDVEIEAQNNDYVAYLYLERSDNSSDNLGKSEAKIGNDNNLGNTTNGTKGTKGTNEKPDIIADKTAGQQLLSIVLLLCRPHLGAEYWQAAIRRYSELAKAKKLLVYGVFRDEGQASSYKDQIKEAGLRVTTSGQLQAVLENWKRNWGK